MQTAISSSESCSESTAPPITSPGICFLPAGYLYGAELEYREQGAILVENGCIKALDQKALDIARQKDYPFIRLEGYTIIPGLINSHTHAPMSFFRDLGHGHKAMIENFLFPAEKSLTPELIAPLSYSYIYAGLKSGTTCFADHYYFAGEVAKALDKFGVRGVVGETLADLGGAFPSEVVFSKTKIWIDAWPHSDRIRPAVCPHAADTVSSKLLKAAAAFAKSRKIPLHMHLSQTAGERRRVLKKDKMSPVKKAEKCGALFEHALLVHMISADDNDLKAIKRSGARIALCPTSQIIYEKLAPLKKFHAWKIPLTLATDCAASHDAADLFQEMKLTALLYKMQKLAFAPKDILKMVTIHPAQVFGMSSITGSIAPGKSADLVFIKDDLGTLPLADIYTHLLFSLSSAQIQHVMIDGKFALWRQTLTQLDEKTLEGDYIHAVQEIKRRAGF